MWDWFEETPDRDWSSSLFLLMKRCFEKGMTLEEVFIVARDAACNKYRRDNRPDSHLWADVKRVAQKVAS